MVEYKEQLLQKARKVGTVSDVLEQHKWIHQDLDKIGGIYIPPNTDGECYLAHDNSVLYIVTDSDAGLFIRSSVHNLSALYKIIGKEDGDIITETVETYKNVNTTGYINKYLEDIPPVKQNITKINMFMSKPLLNKKAELYNLLFTSNLSELSSFTPEDILNLSKDDLDLKKTYTAEELYETLCNTFGAPAQPIEEEAPDPPNEAPETSTSNQTSSLPQEEDDMINKTTKQIEKEIHEMTREEAIQILRALGPHVEPAIAAGQFDKLKTMLPAVQSGDALAKSLEAVSVLEQSAPVAPVVVDPTQARREETMIPETEQMYSFKGISADDVEAKAKAAEALYTNIQNVAVRTTADMDAVQAYLDRHAHLGHFIVSKIGAFSVGVDSKVVEKDGVKQLIDGITKEQYDMAVEERKNRVDKKNRKLYINGKEYNPADVFQKEGSILFKGQKPTRALAAVVTVPKGLYKLDKARPETFSAYVEAMKIGSPNEDATVVTKVMPLISFVTLLSTSSVALRMKEDKAIFNGNCKGQKGVHQDDKFYSLAIQDIEAPKETNYDTDDAYAKAKKRYKPFKIVIRHENGRGNAILHENNTIPVRRPKTISLAMVKKEDWDIINKAVFGKFTGFYKIMSKGEVKDPAYNKLTPAEQAKITKKDGTVTSKFFCDGARLEVKGKHWSKYGDDNKPVEYTLTEVPRYKMGKTQPAMEFETLGEGTYSLEAIPVVKVLQGTTKTSTIGEYYANKISSQDILDAVADQLMEEKKMNEAARGTIDGEKASILLSMAAQDPDLAKNLNMPLQSTRDLQSLGI